MITGWLKSFHNYTDKPTVILKRTSQKEPDSVNQRGVIVEKNPKSFRRGLFDTAIGLLHVLTGFTATLWAVIRITLIGYREVLQFGIGLTVFNYLLEMLPIILWTSGIGILRGKRWGKILGSLWAGLFIIVSLSSFYIRKAYWGILTSPPDWGEMLMIYYASLFLLGMALKPAIRALAPTIRAYISEWNLGNELTRPLGGFRKNYGGKK